MEHSSFGLLEGGMKKMENQNFERPRFGITNDHVFAKTMSERKDLVAELVKRVVGHEVDIETVNQQEVREVKLDGKGVRYDVYLATSQQEIYDLEMQTIQQRNLAKRSRYYISINDVDASLKGDKWTYNMLPKSYVIFLCTFDPFRCGAEMYVANEHLFLDSECTKDVTKEAGYNADYVKIFLNVGNRVKIHNVKETGLDVFLRYVRTGVPTDQFTRDVNDYVCEVNRTDREDLMTLEQDMLEMQQIYFNEGLEKGLEKGKQDSARTLVLDMYNKKYPLEDIISLSHLSGNEINAIIEEHENGKRSE